MQWRRGKISARARRMDVAHVLRSRPVGNPILAGLIAIVVVFAVWNLTLKDLPRCHRPANL